MARRSQILNRELPGWLSAVLVFGTFAAVVYAELKRPLRQMRQDKLERDSRNVAMALMSLATISLTERPVTRPLAQAVQRNDWGLLKQQRLPVVVEILLGVMLMDYTLYIWHYLTHKVKFLWRFHQAHHVDMDLDASTATRFHAGEMFFSVPWRAAQILVLGISPLSLSIWQTVTTMEILFHHSNARLPLDWERRLCGVIVTPRMHGVHHSIVREETDSNWSTIFNWPDRLHGTLQLNVPQQKITIGVAAFQDPAELTLRRIVKMPFTESRPSWQLPDGRKPRREEPPALPATALAG